MSSETITRNDLANILNEIVAIDGTDMTAQEISDFVDSLNCSSVGFPITVEWKTLDFGSCKNQTDYRQTLDITKSGYTGWGVIAYKITGSWCTHFTITEMYITNGVTLTCALRSTNATTFTSDHTYVEALVLYKRTT